MPDKQQTNPVEMIETMQSQIERPLYPEYLEWLDRRADAEGGAQDRRPRDIVRGLTRVALRGLEGTAEYTDKEPALQARYWYRSLGPLNPLEEVEPDLLQAAKMMYGKESSVAKESANLQLDSAYSLLDLAVVAQSPERRHTSLMLGLQATRRITENAKFESQPGSYRLQTAILEGDILQALTRSRYIGSLQPHAAPHEQYSQYETAFAQQELAAISKFGGLVKDGITDENFGMLFEWYFILAQRHATWSKQTIDTEVVRGATSRENAEWTGEDELDLERITGNHDVVAKRIDESGEVATKRYQLKAIKDGLRRKYHPDITVIDYQDLFKDKFRSIDSATDSLVRNLRQFQTDYRDLT